MSEAPRPYDKRYIQAWTLLSIVLGFVLLGMFFLGPYLMHAGHVIWALLRWIFRPII